MKFTTVNDDMNLTLAKLLEDSSELQDVWEKICKKRPSHTPKLLIMKAIYEYAWMISEGPQVMSQEECLVHIETFASVLWDREVTVSFSEEEGIRIQEAEIRTVN